MGGTDLQAWGGKVRVLVSNGSSVVLQLGSAERFPANKPRH